MGEASRQSWVPTAVSAAIMTASKAVAATVAVVRPVACRARNTPMRARVAAAAAVQDVVAAAGTQARHLVVVVGLMLLALL